MEIKIRKANKKDMAGIYGLVKELALYEKEPEAVTSTIEDYEKNFEEGVFEALVAESEGKVVGMALYFLAWSTWKGRMLYLDDFVVTESLRGHGVGQLIFDELIKVAVEKNVALMKWNVIDWNEPAIRFYVEKYNAELDKKWFACKLWRDQMV